MPGREHHHHGGVYAIVRSACSHTVQVTVFIYAVTLVLVAALETVGEPALAAFLSGNEALAVFASALVGLIPNCAASVVVTQLYLEGVLSFGAMIAGTLVGAGTGFLVLFTALLPEGTVGIMAVLWRFTAEYFPFLLGAFVSIRAFGSNIMSANNLKERDS